MQTIIKFRGKTVDNGEWVYGDLLNHSYLKDNSIGIRYFDEKNKCFISRKILKETLGRYTGLKDKNGVEIYEGDVVYIGIYSYIEPLLCGEVKVVFSENRASFVFKRLEGNVCYSLLDELIDVNDFYAYEIEVVRNVYEVKHE